MPAKKLLSLIGLLVGLALFSTSASGQQSALTTPVAKTEHFVQEPIFGDSLYIVEYGESSKPCIILIHGVGREANTVWNDVIPLLSDRYHVITFDLPGFGRSSHSNKLYSPNLYAAMVRWITDEFDCRENVTLVGHSVGAGIALCYSGTYPQQVDHLIISDLWGVLHRNTLTRYAARIRSERAPGLLGKSLEIINDMWISTIDAVESIGLQKDINKTLQNPDSRSRYLGEDAGRIAGLAMVQYNFNWALERVKAPVDIVWGAEDRLAPLRTARALLARLPQASLTTIPGAGHSPMLEQAESYQKVLLEILRNPSPADDRGGFIPVIRNKDSESRWISGKKDLLIDGAYDTLSIRHSRNIQLKNVTARFVEIASSTVHLDQCNLKGEETALYIGSSEVTIDNSRITAAHSGLRARGAEVEMTGVTIIADTAITTSRSRFDLAAVDLQGRTCASAKDASVQLFLPVPDKSDLLFSISHVASPLRTGPVHGFYQVTPEEAF